jgi:hypothetical protein
MIKSLTKDKNRSVLEYYANVFLKFTRMIFRLFVLIIAPHKLIPLLFSKSKRVMYFDSNRPITSGLVTIKSISEFMFFPIYWIIDLFRFLFRNMSTDEVQSNTSQFIKGKSDSRVTIIQLPWLGTFLVSILFGIFGVDRFLMRHFFLGGVKLALLLYGLFASFDPIAYTLQSIGGFLALSDILRIGLKSNFNGVEWVTNGSESLKNKNNPFIIS